MAELTRISANEASESDPLTNGRGTPTSKKDPVARNRAESDLRTGISESRSGDDVAGLGSETEKERAIAKAALTIAELGR